MRTIKPGYITVTLLAIAGLATWHSMPAVLSRANTHQQGIATTPINHVVVIMMENHTFDNLFGRYPGANGVSNLPRAGNHIAMVAAQNGGIFASTPENGCNSIQNDLMDSKAASGKAFWGYPCYNINSLPKELDAAGISWKYYSAVNIWDAPILLQSDYQSANNVNNPNQFAQDVSAGNMANVTWLTPPANASDHPPIPLQAGQNFV